MRALCGRGKWRFAKDLTYEKNYPCPHSKELWDEEQIKSEGQVPLNYTECHYKIITEGPWHIWNNIFINTFIACLILLILKRSPEKQRVLLLLSYSHRNNGQRGNIIHPNLPNLHKGSHNMNSKILIKNLMLISFSRIFPQKTDDINSKKSLQKNQQYHKKIIENQRYLELYLFNRKL